MLEGIIESVDQWYSENLAVETKRGQIQNAKDGFSTGGRPPYGLRRVEVKNEHGAAKAKWEPDPNTSKVVQRIYDMYGNGSGYKTIAQALNTESIPSPSGSRWNANTLHYIFCTRISRHILASRSMGAKKGRTDPGKGSMFPKMSGRSTETRGKAIITEDQASMASARSRGPP